MRLVIIAIVFNIMMINSIAEGGTVIMHELLEQRAMAYKLREGIDKFKSAPDNQGVVIDDWDKILDNSSLKKNNWQIGKGYIPYCNYDNILHDWLNRKEKETLRLEVLVSSKGNNVALDNLVERVVSRSSGLFPHERSSGPGDLYVSYITESAREIIWVYRNICFIIKHRGTGDAENRKLTFDTVALANEIQQYAEKHLVDNIQDYYPKIGRAELSQPKIYVGDTFSINLVMVGKKSVDEYGMDYETNHDYLESEGQKGLVKKFTASKPGTTEVTFTVWDKKTMLSTQKTIKIEVLEKEKKQ